MLKLTPQYALGALLIGAGALLSACGGGGGSSPTVVTPPPPPVSSSDPTYTPGVFEDESKFAGMCETPRAGTSDQAGSTLLENFWLRSWSNNIYLFFNEIPDQDPGTFNDRLQYFSTLKTTATTASGAPKDQFHFTMPSDEYEQLRATGASPSYGIDLALLATSPPRDIRIAYIEPNTPASDANLARGYEILEVDGVDAVNGGSQSDVDTLNAALFPDGAGETHEFVMRPTGSTQTITVTLTSEIVEVAPVNRTKVIDTANGKVGYIHFTTFSPFTAEKALFDAFTALEAQNVGDLVLDLRYNGGGLLAVSSQLAYMVAGDTQTRNRVYEEQVWNSQHPSINPVTGQALRPLSFLDEGVGFSVTEGQPLPALNLKRVYVLGTSGTCSASEAFINGLRGIDVEVILVGGRTCGKPYGFYPTDNCGETYFTLQFKGVNDKDFGDYADGFSPANSTASVFGETVDGCAVPDDFTKQLGDPDEAMLAAALKYREDGTCPAVSAQAKTSPLRNVGKPQSAFDTADLLSDPRIQQTLFIRQNRILQANDDR